MSRGPKPPDRPSDRPTVPEVAAMLRIYRRLPNRSLGGAVHVVVDDGNVEQAHIDWCVGTAREGNGWWTEGPDLVARDVEIAEALAAMTPTQRRKIAGMSTHIRAVDEDDLDLAARAVTTTLADLSSAPRAQPTGKHADLQGDS